MRKTTRILVPLALILGATAVSTQAEARVRRPYKSMRPAGVMDQNRDGVVTRREMRRFHRAEAAATVRRLDHNRDGWLSRWELRSAPARYRSFKGFDLNRNGSVGRFERNAAQRARAGRGLPVSTIYDAEMREARRNFQRLDWNNDGVLTRRELRAEQPKLRRLARR